MNTIPRLTWDRSKKWWSICLSQGKPCRTGFQGLTAVPSIAVDKVPSCWQFPLLSSVQGLPWFELLKPDTPFCVVMSETFAFFKLALLLHFPYTLFSRQCAFSYRSHIVILYLLF